MSLTTEGSNPPAGGINIVLVNVPCDPTVIVTDAVKMLAGVAYKAQADVYANSNVIGIVQKKNSSTTCDIRVAGITPEIFSGLDETKEYLLSAAVAGEIVPETSSPSAPGNVLLRLGQPFSPTQLFVFKGLRMIRS